jgi:hypothetical protein
MFPFYDDVIAPIIRACAAQRVLEIGVRRGATTAQLLEQLGPSVELHAIDPVPDFDAAEVARSFPGRYVLHTDTSHNVLPLLPPVDVALIDGDHNWFTVFHELRFLSEVARDAGTQLPVCILHDVGWPYGRRDLYYAPERIPSEFRHEHAQRGLHPGRRDFVNGSGGINASMHNAVIEGGQRNGVMTAVDDFVAGYDKPLRTLVLPIYFGLAIVAEEERIARRPELGAVLDWLESTDGKERLLQLSESIRLRGVAHQHNLLSRTQGRYERVRARYLGTLKASLVERAAESDEHADRVMLDRIERGLDVVRKESIPGDLVTDASALGTSGIFMRGYLDAYDLSGRTVWVGVTVPVDEVEAAFARVDLLDDNVRVVASNASDGFPSASEAPIALLHVAGTDAPALSGVLEAQSDRLAPGAVVIVDADRGVDATACALVPLDAENGLWRRSQAHAAGSNPPERPVASAP